LPPTLFFVEVFFACLPTVQLQTRVRAHKRKSLRMMKANAGFNVKYTQTQTHTQTHAHTHALYLSVSLCLCLSLALPPSLPHGAKRVSRALPNKRISLVHNSCVLCESLNFVDLDVQVSSEGFWHVSRQGGLDVCTPNHLDLHSSTRTQQIYNRP
jgi:hypothetical protein